MGFPRFSGDKSLVDGFMRSGFPRELARKRIAVGCNWMGLPGLEYTLNDVVNINIINAGKILQAHENPDLYPDLIVRVTGFTAYFSSLSKEFRQLVVDRIITE